MTILTELSSITRQTQSEKDSHYKSGSIKRIKLKNFLTYDAVEFMPGPRLNVVVGPNGTGKSTILCAICLGLGGQPPLLGRADDARLFIKHEKESASIEIELAPKINSNSGKYEATHIITRVIERNRGSEKGKGAGASLYYINGHKCNLKSVKELVSDRYKIHIDNLCTFLPQDKVGNFSGFDKQALLVETEKSLSGHLYSTHQDLIKLESELQSSGTDVATIQTELSKLTKENERLEREKELMEQREQYIERIDLLKKKRAWLVFDQKREEAKNAKEKREELKKQKKEAEKAIRPLQEKHAEVESEVGRIQSRYKALDTKVRNDKKSYEDAIRKSDNYRDQIEEEANELDALDSQHRRNKKAVEKERARLQEIEEQGNDYPPMNEIQEIMTSKQAAMRRIKSQIQAEKREAADAEGRINEAREEKESSEGRLDRMKDDKAQRLNAFCRQFKNVGQAYTFIKDNRKMFRKKVWGPVAVEVLPKNREGVAASVEQHVATATWKSFVVECKEDYDLLYREVRQKRSIPINIIIVDRIQERPRLYSEKKMDVLKKEHGFNGYLDECFTAPGPIMQALKNKHNIDRVLMGGEAVHNSLERKDLVEYLSAKEGSSNQKQSSCFFYTYKGSIFKYTSQVSRYTGDIGGTDIVDITPAKILKPGTDPRLIEQLKQKIKKCNEIMTELQPRDDAAKARVDELNKQGQTVSQEFKEAKRAKQEYTQWKSKLRNQREKVEEAEELAAKDNDREKAKKITKIKKVIESSIAMAEQAGEVYNQIIKSTHTLTGAKMTEDGLQESFRHLADQLREKQEATNELTNQYKAADLEYNQKKDILKKLLKEAETIAPKDQWQERLDEDDLPENLEGIEDALDEAENKVSSITDNPHVMRQYEERKKEIAKLQEQLDGADEEKDIKKKQLEVKLTTWEASLINIVDSVSQKFSAYMKEVGCAGEVRLFKANRDARGGDDEEENLVYNFKNWGVEILVKFREASSLQVLSAQTHSGGERSVSTIMYLMGLQNLMSSPFRCVDEINQGLDERNERLVFKRIVMNSTIEAGSSNDDHCGQYFLITPKLLPNLDGMENENITVLFVFSGAHNFENCLDWNVDKFIEDKKRFLIENGIDDDDEESVSRGSKKRKSKK